MANIFQRIRGRLRPGGRKASLQTPSGTIVPAPAPDASLLAPTFQPHSPPLAEVDAPSAAQPQAGTPLGNALTNNSEVYERGLFNGSLRLERAHFEQRIDAGLHVELLDELHKQYIKKADACDSQLARRLALELAREESALEVQHLQGQLDVNGQRQQAAQTQIDDLNKNLVNTRKAAFLPGIWLFTLAAFFFFVADVSLTHQVAIKGLGFDMPNLKSTNLKSKTLGWEAWVLAIALSSIGMLLKPAFSRLFENGYQQHLDGNEEYSDKRHKKANHVLFAILAVFAILLLGAFGMVRKGVEAKAQIEDQIEKLNNISIPPSDTAQYNQNSKDITNQVQLRDKEEAQMSFYKGVIFIGFGVLFAIGSSICIELALEGWNKRSKRRQWQNELKVGLSPELKSLKEKYDQLHMKLLEARKLLARQEAELKSIPAREVLLAESREQTHQLTAGLKDRATKSVLSLTSTYRDGYAHGEFREVPDKPIVTYGNLYRNHGEVSGNAYYTYGNNGGSSNGMAVNGNTAASTQERPFVELRRRIRRRNASRHAIFNTTN